MSDSARKFPGQSILERLYARGAVRPAIGVSPSFFERFGLTDPWVDLGDLQSWDLEGDGFFTFLSAAPYYARLRAQRQRAYRARRRLLNRLSQGYETLLNRSMGRLVPNSEAEPPSSQSPAGTPVRQMFDSLVHS